MGDHVGIVGTGLIGGSLARAFVRAGYEVRGYDRDETRLKVAIAEGVVSSGHTEIAEVAADADLVVVALPVSSVAEAVVAALDAGAAVVTDVGSVKAPIVRAVEQARPDEAARFVGGHPMAGSEQEGLSGADPDLFQGATWVLTPTPTTDPGAFAKVRTLVGSLGADVLAVEPDHHDALVAVVSHVPHLAAGTLMLMAAREAHDASALLRLAAGGFRDMTRIAAGHPGIWPDICVENRDAIVAALDAFLEQLTAMRSAVAAGDRTHLLQTLEAAREARVNLPAGATTADRLVELRIPVPDRPGVLAEVTTLAGQQGVNIVDLEIAHSVEGAAGVLVVMVAADASDRFGAALEEKGYRLSKRVVE